MKNTKTSETDAFWKTLRQGLTGKHAPNGKVPQVLFGKVTQFNPNRNFGIAVVDYSPSGGIKRGFSLSTDNGPFSIGIDRNSSFPAFAKLSDVYPPVGAKVVLEVTGLNGSMKVSRWGCAEAYWEAEDELNARRGSIDEAIYRVIRDNRFMGKMMATRFRNQVVFEGTLREMETQSRRDGLPVSTTDKFAPVYENELFSTMNRFERKNDQDGSWTSCDDPRPFPATGPVYRLMYWKDGIDTELAIGQALRINLKFPRGDKDPLAKYITGEANSGGYLYWLRQEPKTFGSDPKNSFASTETVWVETSDPRPMPVKINKIRKLATTNRNSDGTAPEAMPKKLASERKFSIELKDLGQLSRLDLVSV
jgi:hypothetical protein